ncbi:MAG TPA: isochorismatase family cysteine hydrolase [Geobacterales bacterium]|nr:isochorismatase family cysteine hydrolase [Geobacterales bacterium]
MDEAVLVIDMLNDFVYGSLRCDRAKRIIPNIKRLLEEARKHGVPVIYVGDAHLPKDPEIELWGQHAMKGTEGSKTIAELEPQAKDFVLEKRTYSAFHETGLDLLLRQLNVKKVIITGLHTNICDRHTAADAYFRGYKIKIPEDCVDSFTEKDHLEGLEYLKRIYGAEITNSEEIIKAWKTRI